MWRERLPANMVQVGCEGGGTCSGKGGGGTRCVARGGAVNMVQVKLGGRVRMRVAGC